MALGKTTAAILLTVSMLNLCIALRPHAKAEGKLNCISCARLKLLSDNDD